MAKISKKLILCADVWKLYKYPDGEISGGSNIPLEIDMTKKLTDKRIRKECDLAIEAHVEPYVHDKEIMWKDYEILNLDCIKAQYEREAKRNVRIAKNGIVSKMQDF